MPDELPNDYRLAPLVVARFVGLYLVLFALVVLAATALVALLRANPLLIVVVLALGLVGIFVLGWWLRSRVVVLHCDLEGYRVRMVRGAGVKAATWTEVEDAATTTSRDEPVVVLRLVDGRTTSIPTSVLAVDRELFVRQLQRHLRAGQKVRKL